jgi:hypothetical protein
MQMLLQSGSYINTKSLFLKQLEPLKHYKVKTKLEIMHYATKTYVGVIHISMYSWPQY